MAAGVSLVLSLLGQTGGGAWCVGGNRLVFPGRWNVGDTRQGESGECHVNGASVHSWAQTDLPGNPDGSADSSKLLSCVRKLGHFILQGHCSHVDPVGP